MTRTIGIYVFDDVEVLDFAGPYEVFTCATRVGRKLAPDAPPPFRVRTIGRTSALLRARAGLAIFPESDIGRRDDIDVLIVPGGAVDAELVKPDVVAWIAATARDCELVASVRTGAFLLAQAGLLDGQQLATQGKEKSGVDTAYPELRIQGKRRWTDNGAIVSSGGSSAGIDLSLHLVERLAGRELALATARQMDYDWSRSCG